MKNLFFDENYNVADFTFILSNRNYDHLGEIVNVEWESINYNAPLQSAKEISFTVFKELNGHTEKLWNKIKDLKLVWVKELDEYFEIRVSTNDSSAYTQKVVTGTSLCESELSQTLIETLEINTAEDIEREDYDPEHPTVFYNPDEPTHSLLNKILSKNPNYHIGYVSPTLYDIVRQFSISEKTVYDFMVNDLAQEIQCMFQFDSTTRTVSVYDLNEERNPDGYGEDTSVYIDVENLSDEIKFETDVDSIKNCFRLKAGDDTITAAIRAINPTGSNCIYYFSQEQKQDMPSELVDKIEEYEKLCVELKPEYVSLTSNLYDAIDNIIYYTSGMMPEIPSVEITAKTEADKLTVENLNPIAVSKFENQLIPSETTVNSAVLNYAKSIIRTGYVKLTIDHSNYVYNETDGIKTGTWTGSFKVENYSNKEDIVITSDISLSITGNSDEYIKQRMLKTISSNDDEDYSLSAIINKTNEQFTVEINKYCKNRVQSFYDAINEGINVLVQTSFAQSSNDSDSAYQTIYLPLYEKSNLCLLRLKELDETISTYENEKISIENRIKEIQNTLDFEKKLGDLYPLFCSYRREQVYQNDNYISDGLDNSQVLEKAQEFISIAEKELIKSGEFQHSISATLYNLMLLPEFKNILKKLDLGNWIRVGVDGNVYKLRFIRYSINCSNTDNIEVEFTDIIKDKSDSVSDLHSLLSVTQNMSSTYDYVSRQSSSGNNAFVQINQMYRNGLNSALMRIKNNNNEEVVCNNLGIMAREYDDIEEKYSPEQIRVTHNAIVMTEDNWKSASLAIGKNEYYKFEENEKGEKVLVTRNGYGVVARFLNAPYVTGGQIIGGDIYSSNYDDTGNIQTSSGSYIDLENGHLWLGAGRLVWDGNEFHIYDMYGNDLYTRVENIEHSVSDFYVYQNSIPYTISSTDENPTILGEVELFTSIDMNLLCVGDITMEVLPDIETVTKTININGADSTVVYTEEKSVKVKVTYMFSNQEYDTCPQETYTKGFHTLPLSFTLEHLPTNVRGTFKIKISVENGSISIAEKQAAITLMGKDLYRDGDGVNY